MEYKYVLMKTQEILHRNMGFGYVYPLLCRQAPNIPQDKRQPLLAAGNIKFASISGVINSADCERFKRLIFRVSRRKHQFRD